jgi:hypothetical protein
MKSVILALLVLSTFNVYAAEKHLILIGSTSQAVAFKPASGVQYTQTTADRLLPHMQVTNLSGLGRTAVNAWQSRLDLAARYALNPFAKNAVVIDLGFDDWGQGIPLPTFRANYINLLNGLKYAGQSTKFCALPLRTRIDTLPDRNKAGLTLEQYRATIRSIANTGACTLITSDTWFTFADVYNTNLMKDGINMTIDGHARFSYYLLINLRLSAGF